MKRLFYIAAFIIFFSCEENSTSKAESTFGDVTTVEIKPPNDSLVILRDIKSIDDIKKEYSYITSKIESGHMDSASFNYNCRDEKSGKLTYFTEKGQLRLIKHTYNEYSHFSATDEYFVKDGALFFVFKDQLVWSFVNQNQTKDDFIEKRIYIIDKTPIKCLEKKYTILSNNKDTLRSDLGSNKEIKCAPLDPTFEDFKLFFKLRNQKKDLICLES